MRRRLTDAEQAAELRRQSLLAEKAKAQNAMGQLAISREKASRTCFSDSGKYIIAHIPAHQQLHRADGRALYNRLRQLLQVKMAQARTEQQREVAANAAAQLAERDAQCAALQAQLDGRALDGRTPNSAGSSGEGMRAPVAVAWLIATHCRIRS